MDGALYLCAEQPRAQGTFLSFPIPRDIVLLDCVENSTE